ncbi:MFS general substrate transporter [Apiospora marii]|uniref:MFS general substrate transporter n=1 Tax=Apiospora marii TaxID=335849 RepID=A0ABR1STR2_9PEZI
MGTSFKESSVSATNHVPVDVSQDTQEKKSVRRRFRELVWDSLDRSPEERRFISKIDFYILTWAGLAYFSKNLNQNNVANAYVSGMKEELNVVGNEYQTFTTMWTIGYVISQIPSQIICTRGMSRSLLTLAKADNFLFISPYLCLVPNLGATMGTRDVCHRDCADLAPFICMPLLQLGKRACIFFASAFIGSMFSGYLQAALYTGMNGVGGLSGWRWLFIFDGIITLPMAIWAYYALPDLPSNTRVRWLTPEEKQLALDRMKRAGKQLDEPFTLVGLKRILGKWHFWVYTAYYTFFICSENIGTYMNLWLKSLNRYTVPQINNFPTVTNAVTIVTTLAYGWVSDGLQIRAPIVYFSLTVCFFAAMNLAIWDGVPFGLKWASFYMTGFAQGSGPIFLTMVNEHCAGDSLERKFILGTTNSIAYAFNAWIALVTYNTTYAPRFLVGNSVTAGLIICAAMTLKAAVLLQRRDGHHGKEKSPVAVDVMSGDTRERDSG